MKTKEYNPWDNPWRAWGDYWNILEAISIEYILMNISYNLEEITEETVKKEIREIFEQRKRDFEDLLERELPAIVKRAKSEGEI